MKINISQDLLGFLIIVSIAAISSISAGIIVYGLSLLFNLIFS